MSKKIFEKLSDAIQQGRIREIREAVDEVKRVAARERPDFATVKLAAVYDSAEDCLAIHYTVDLGATEECLGILSSAVLAPDGDSLLYASTALLDPHKHNKCASGCSIVHHLAHSHEGQCVTVHVCALAVDARGKVTLVSAEEPVTISVSRPKL